MIIKNKICKNCRDIFSDGRSDKKFCCKKCRKDYHNKNNPKRIAQELFKEHKDELLDFLNASLRSSKMNLYFSRGILNSVSDDKVHYMKICSEIENFESNVKYLSLIQKILYPTSKKVY